MIFKCHRFNKLISVLIVVLLVLMMVMGSYIEGHAVIGEAMTLGAIGALAGGPIGYGIAIAAFLTLSSIGINWSTDQQVAAFNEAYLKEQQDAEILAIIGIVSESSCFKGKTADEIDAMTSFSYTDAEWESINNWVVANLDNFLASINDASVAGTLNERFKIKVTSYDVPFFNALGYSFSYSSEARYVFQDPAGKQIMKGYSSMFRMPLTAYVIPFSGGKIGCNFTADQTGYPLLAGQTIHTFGRGKYGEYVSVPSMVVLGASIDTATHTSVDVPSNAVISVPKVSTLDDLAKVTSAELVGSAVVNPDPPDESVESKNILNWLTGVYTTMMSDVAGTLADIKAYFTNVANPTSQGILDGVMSIPQSISRGIDSVLEGLRGIPIPLLLPLTTLVDLVKSLSEATTHVPDGVSKGLDFSKLRLPIKSKFPFCIPFDFINLITAFSSNPTDFSFEIKLDTVYFKINHIVDLTPFRLPILFFRYLTVAWFSLILMNKTKEYMKW